MEAAETTHAVHAAVLAVDSGFHAMTDDELLAQTERWEALGRVVDARRIAAAAEIERRSRTGLGEQGLAFREGRKDGSDLVAAVARVSSREATRRIGLGAALAPRAGLRGEELPGRFPEVAAAVRAGELGLEAARVIVDALDGCRRRAPAEDLRGAEAGLTESGTGTTPDLLRVHATMWAARLDPDGAEPSEEERRRHRSFRFGRLRTDGLTPFHGFAQPEEVALVRAGLQAHRPEGPMIRTEAGGDGEGGGLDPEWVEAEGERRTTAQRDYDTVFAILAAGLRAEQDGSGGSLKTPHEVLVHVTAEDAASRRGECWAEGVAARLSIPAVERIACSGGVRLVVLDAAGEPLHLGRTARLFTAAQRKALAARYGGCAWPGCTAPLAWSEAHHIGWWQRDAGPTDIDNGVLLCTRHHHLVHASDPAFRIELRDRRPHLVPRGWHGPPAPQHRMQRHPLLLPPRGDDPWRSAA